MTIQEPNRTNDAIALEAIRKALQQLDSLLPKPLQQEIKQQLSQVLDNPQTEDVNNLIKLARTHELLYQTYRTIRKELFDNYQAQPKDKGYPPREKEIPPITTPNILDNTVAPTPTPANSSPETQGQANTTTQGQQSST
jgi:hypothetical protein